MTAPRHIGLAGLLLTATLGFASTDSSMLPDGREKTDVQQNERNPFAQQIIPEAAPTTQPAGTSEEARLRKILRALKVSGASGSGESRRVLLGSVIIKPGETLPQLLENQSEQLRVVSVDDRTIRLEFIERDPSIDARQIIIPISVKPAVSALMYGDAFESITKMSPQGLPTVPPLTNPGVEDFKKGSTDADLKNMSDRDVELMGVVTNAEQPAKK